MCKAQFHPAAWPRCWLWLEGLCVPASAAPLLCVSPQECLCDPRSENSSVQFAAFLRVGKGPVLAKGSKETVWRSGAQGLQPTYGGVFSLCWIHGERSQNTQPFLKKKNKLRNIFFTVIIVASPSAFSCEEILSFQIILDWHLVGRNWLCYSWVSCQWLTWLTSLFFLLWCVFLMFAVPPPLPRLGLPCRAVCLGWG